jgi:lysophospholipase L1-like esterase
MTGFCLTAVALALGVTCVAAEVGLRIAGIDQTYLTPLGSFFELDPLLGFRGRPNFSGRFRQTDFDIRVVHDAQGFRRHEYLPAPSAPKGAVFVLGDSFTWGYGVGQGAVYTDLMQQYLPDRHVRNFALCASGTVQQYAIFDRHVRPSLEPGDVVIVAFYANDFDDNAGKCLTLPRLHAEIRDNAVREVSPRHSRLATLKKQLKESSCLVNLAACAWDCIHEPRSPSEPATPSASPATDEDLPPEPAPAFGDDRPELTITGHYLTLFRDACRAKGAQLLVAYIPEPSEYGEHDTARATMRAAERRALLAHAAELDVATFDLLPVLSKRHRGAGPDRLTFANDFHWNEHGHQLAAAALAQAIRATSSTELASN